MRDSEARTSQAIQCLHLLLCAVVALCVANAVRVGSADWLPVATLAACGSLALTFGSASVTRSHAGPLAGGPVVARRVAPPRRARPGYHAYVRRRLGDPRHVGRFAFQFSIRPLLAPSFVEFWRYWNPPYAYVLRYFVYAPLRARVPHRLALYLTFLASGFLLHDLPFNFTADWSRGASPVPAVTMLFAVLGGLTLLSDALKLDLSRAPAWARVTANLAWIAAAFAIRALLFRVWRAH